MLVTLNLTLEKGYSLKYYYPCVRNSRLYFKIVSVQYLKEYLTYPHQLWYTEIKYHLGKAKTVYKTV